MTANFDGLLTSYNAGPRRTTDGCSSFRGHGQLREARLASTSPGDRTRTLAFRIEIHPVGWITFVLASRDSNGIRVQIAPFDREV